MVLGELSVTSAFHAACLLVVAVGSSQDVLDVPLRTYMTLVFSDPLLPLEDLVPTPSLITLVVFSQC